MKQLNLFVMAPLVNRAGPNAVDIWGDNASMYVEVRKSLSELGRTFSGQCRSRCRQLTQHQG